MPAVDLGFFKGISEQYDGNSTLQDYNKDSMDCYFPQKLEALIQILIFELNV